MPPGTPQRPNPTGPSPASRDAWHRQISQARHDLRNPLAHILGFTEMLIEKAGDRGLNFLKSRLQWIERSATELTQAVNTELDAPHLEAGTGNISGLLEKLEKQSKRIGQAADRLRRRPAVREETAMETDLGRVAGAAYRLRDLAAPTLAFLRPPSPGSGKAARARRQPMAEPAQATVQRPSILRTVVWLEDAAGYAEVPRVLADLGHEVHEVRSESDLWNHLAAGLINLVVLDPPRAEADQGRLIRQLRQRPGTESPAVLVVCAPDQLEAAARAVERGADDCLCQPFLPVLVRARVEGCLARRRQEAPELNPSDED